MSIVKINDDNFKAKVLEYEGVAIVDFFAEWCGPCRMISPIFEQVSKEADKKVKFGKLNVDEARKTAAEYGVMSVPTIIIFKDGEKKEVLTGVQDKEAILKKIEELTS